MRSSYHGKLHLPPLRTNDKCKTAAEPCCCQTAPNSGEPGTKQQEISNAGCVDSTFPFPICLLVSNTAGSDSIFLNQLSFP